jgi:hypothetical protein
VLQVSCLALKSLTILTLLVLGVLDLFFYVKFSEPPLNESFGVYFLLALRGPSTYLAKFKKCSLWTLRGSKAEVHKVPEYAYLVCRKFWKFSLLAENVDQNPLVENAETFLSLCYFILTENCQHTETT